MHCMGAIAGPKIAVRRKDLPMPAMKHTARLSIIWAWMALAALPCAAQKPTTDPNGVRTVVIDAGHGGRDPGAVGTGRYKAAEKDVALKVSLLVGKYIREAFPEVKVVYTRDDDRFVELMERSNIANRAKADLFISIHCNSSENPAPYGAETFVMGLHKTEANMKVAMKENAAILLEEGHQLRYDGFDPKDPESIIALSLRQNVHLDHSLLFSAMVQRQFKDRVGRYDRGVKQAGFLVISYTTMPSVLIELGFLSNPKEEDFLQSGQGQDFLASAIYRAFKEYKLALEGVAVAPPKPLPVPPEGQGEEAAPQPSGTPAVVVADGVRFKVQVHTSSKAMATTPDNFKGLAEVEEHKGAGLFRYTVGNEATLAGARQLQQTCRDKGFDGAFIVAFKGGERIDLQEAVKLAQGQ